jgi:hypothetical protein
MLLRRIWARIYGDFLMPSRLGTYRTLLETALRAGYSILSIEQFWALIGSGTVDPARRYLVLRNDVDTGPRTAEAMWRIEHSLGITGSYFFRLSTLDLALMNDIAAAGGEASYHYEELASVAKRRHLRSRSDVLEHLTEAQDLFRTNVDRLRAQSGQPIRVVASHGDFVNRKLGLTNWLILDDPAFRREAGIELETYDHAFMSHVTSRHADLTSPPYWTPADPAEAVTRNELVIYLLVHPRGWHVERALNARDDAVRIREGLLYALPPRLDQRSFGSDPTRPGPRV